MMRTPSVSISFLLFFDNLNSQWSNLNRMRESVESFLTAKPRLEDIVAVLSLAGSVQVAQDFTNE